MVMRSDTGSLVMATPLHSSEWMTRVERYLSGRTFGWTLDRRILYVQPARLVDK